MLRLTRRIGARGNLFAAAALAFVLACASPASAQLDQWGFWENGVTEAWYLSSEDFASEDAVNGAARWKSIGEANALDAGGPWAGDYSLGGDTSGTYMRWSPHAGFVIVAVNKCEARVRGLVYGRVEASPTLVQFFPELYKNPASKRDGGEQKRAATTPAVIRYVPVEWRGRRMLIAEDEMKDFGDYVAGLGEYNGIDSVLYAGYDTFFSRMTSGEASDADGAADSDSNEHYARPVVPPGYERFIKKPVEAFVTSVGKRRLKRDYLIEGRHSARPFELASLTSVNIDAGTAQGVKDGMLFRVSEPNEGDIVMIVRAGENESAAVVIRDVNERGAESYYDEEAREKKHSKIVAGWRLTTSLF